MCAEAKAIGSHSGYAFANLATAHRLYYLRWLQKSQFDEGP